MAGRRALENFRVFLWQPIGFAADFKSRVRHVDADEHDFHPAPRRLHQQDDPPHDDVAEVLRRMTGGGDADQQVPVGLGVRGVLIYYAGVGRVCC